MNRSIEMMGLRIGSVLALATMIILTDCHDPAQLSRPNVLLICIDDLRPELGSFGVDYISSPNIDKLAARGMAFQRHYVNAPSCGPSRYTLLTGQYGQAGNDALFNRAESIAAGENIDPSMPEWFRSAGYTTVSVGKVSHHPGGRGGRDWNDETILEMPRAWDRYLMPVGEWEHPRGAMHGLANGEIRIKSGDMDVYQAVVGTDDIYPDGAITASAIEQLDVLTDQNEKPFFLAVGIVKPHLPFGAPRQYYDRYRDVELPPVSHPSKPEGKTTWHRSGEFMQYNHLGKDIYTDTLFADDVRRHYAACVSYADAQVGKLLSALEQSSALDNTIVVLWGDHGWHLGEHSIWGKHSLFEESLRSPLIVYHPDMSHQGENTKALVETIDIFPTLCELTGVDVPAFARGQSLLTILDDPTVQGHAVIGYKNGSATIRTATHRLILHDDGHVELYDHTSEAVESQNIASPYPGVVQELSDALIVRMSR